MGIPAQPYEECAFVPVSERFCSPTDNVTHGSLCGRVGAKLADFRRHEISEVW